MFNKKVILVSGFTRGGTNIAWNLLQSHPGICSPIHETGELYRRSYTLRLCRLFMNLLPADLHNRIADKQLYRFKLKNLDHSENKYVSENKLYTRWQVEEAALCLKSVDRDIFYTEHLLKIYPDLYFIALTRNGYALAEGHIRRGNTATETGKLYQQMADWMKHFARTLPRFKLIRFEEILERPFSIAEELYSFTGVRPAEADKLRLKSKKVIAKEGAHNVAYGQEKRKYWFDRQHIREILDPDVNRKQMNRLTADMIRDFNRQAESALEFFGYEKQLPSSPSG